jgi:hypothetical protein
VASAFYYFGGQSAAGMGSLPEIIERCTEIAQAVELEGKFTNTNEEDLLW